MGNLHYTDSIGGPIINLSQCWKKFPMGVHVFPSQDNYSAAVGKRSDTESWIPLRNYWLHFKTLEPGKHIQHDPAAEPQVCTNIRIGIRDNAFTRIWKDTFVLRCTHPRRSSGALEICRLHWDAGLSMYRVLQLYCKYTHKPYGNKVWFYEFICLSLPIKISGVMFKWSQACPLGFWGWLM